MSFLQQEALIHKLVYYNVLCQTCCDESRLVDCSEAAYNAALADWEGDDSNPLGVPPMDDKQARAIYFAKIDNICHSKRGTPGNIFKVGFASFAGLQVLRGQDLTAFRDDTQNTIMNIVDKLSAEQISQVNPKMTILPDTPDPNLPEHLASAFSRPIASADPGKELVNMTFCYCEEGAGEILECTVMDYVKSTRRGVLFEVAYVNREEDVEVSASEMRHMLANRVS